jgi:hypothetical protein
MKEPMGVRVVSSVIEVFVCSREKDIDYGHYREMSLHWECGLAQWAYGELAAQFKGRILPENDVAVLQQVFEQAKKENSQVKVYDTSRMGDKVRAMKRGVFKTPSAVINGQRYEGLEEILKAIAAKPHL